jgi:hypothetical protein
VALDFHAHFLSHFVGYLQLLACNQQEQIDWIANITKFSKVPKNPLNIGLGIPFGFCDKNICL